jgi:hypothetical protein
MRKCERKRSKMKEKKLKVAQKKANRVPEE